MSLVTFIKHEHFIILAEDTLLSATKKSEFVPGKNSDHSKIFSTKQFAIACYGNFGEKIPEDDNNYPGDFKNFVN